MNVEDFNQVHIRRDMLDYPDLLKEGEVVMIIFNAEDETPLSVEMPANVILTVTHVEPGVKGNTATNATKPATVETGGYSECTFVHQRRRSYQGRDRKRYLCRAHEGLISFSFQEIKNL